MISNPLREKRHCHFDGDYIRALRNEGSLLKGFEMSLTWRKDSKLNFSWCFLFVELSKGFLPNQAS